jgi:hypothetical protein
MTECRLTGPRHALHTIKETKAASESYALLLTGDVATRKVSDVIALMSDFFCTGGSREHQDISKGFQAIKELKFVPPSAT